MSFKWFPVCRKCNPGFTIEYLRKSARDYRFFEWAYPPWDKDKYKEGEISRGFESMKGEVVEYKWEHDKWVPTKTTYTDYFCECKKDEK